MTGLMQFFIGNKGSNGTVPNAPTIGTATYTSSPASASITFTAPSNDGGSPILDYTATSSPGNKTGVSATSPVTVSGLTNGTLYTFTVKARNAIGSSLASSASNQVGVVLPATPTIGTATQSPTVATSASVKFTPGAVGTGTGITYTITSSPQGLTATGSASPITVTGLTDGYTHTFTAKATTSVGSSSNSSVSNSVTTRSHLLLSSSDGYSAIMMNKFYNNTLGTQYSNGSISTSASAAVMTPDESAIIVNETGTYSTIQAARFNYSTGIGTTYSNAPGFAAYYNNNLELSLNPAGDTFFFTNAGASPYVNAYAWSNGFGTKYANPVGGAAVCQAGMFSMDGTKIIATFNTAANGYGAVYAWSNGFGTKTALSLNPSGGSTPYRIVMNRSNNTIATLCGQTGASNPTLDIYSYANGVGTRSSTSIFTSSSSYPLVGITFSPTYDTLVCSVNTVLFKATALGSSLGAATYTSPSFSNRMLSFSADGTLLFGAGGRGYLYDGSIGTSFTIDSGSNSVRFYNKP